MEKAAEPLNRHSAAVESAKDFGNDWPRANVAAGIRNFTRASNPILVNDRDSVCKKWKRRPNFGGANGGSGTSNEGALGFRDFPAVNRRWLQTTVYFPELISHLDNSSNPPGKSPGRSVANPRVNIGSTASSVQSFIITESHNTVPPTMMGRYRAC